MQVHLLPTPRAHQHDRPSSALAAADDASASVNPFPNRTGICSFLSLDILTRHPPPAHPALPSTSTRLKSHSVRARRKRLPSSRCIGSAPVRIGAPSRGYVPPVRFRYSPKTSGDQSSGFV